MWDIFTGPVKDWMPAIIAGVVSIFGLAWTLRNKRGAEGRSELNRLREVEATSEAMHSQDLTARFRALMEGYENRIKDLTQALAESTAEVRRLDKAYDERSALCNNCPIYIEHLRTRDARPAP